MTQDSWKLPVQCPGYPLNVLRVQVATLSHTSVCFTLRPTIFSDFRRHVETSALNHPKRTTNTTMSKVLHIYVLLDPPPPHQPNSGLISYSQDICNISFSHLPAMLNFKCFQIFYLCSAELMKSKIRPSSVRLCHRVSLKWWHGFLWNFSCGFPRAMWPDFENFLDFLQIFLVFVKHGALWERKF